LIAGESERDRNTVAVRDLARGEQVEVDLDNLVDHVTRRLAQEP
jgi:histidyl-tRNA synthetase